MARRIGNWRRNSFDWWKLSTHFDLDLNGFMRRRRRKGQIHWIGGPLFLFARFIIITPFIRIGLTQSFRNVRQGFSRRCFAALEDRPIEALETHPTEPLGPVATLEADEVAIPVRNETPVLPIDLLPFSRVAAVSSVRGRRRTSRTTILTATPEKNAIEEVTRRRVRKSPTRRQKRTRRKLNDENVPSQQEIEFDLDIDPLYRPQYTAPAPTTTRSGRRTKANPRPDV